jgi:hypothetical protein
MNDDDQPFEGFEEMLRTFARELSRSAERLSEIDFDAVAQMFGFDSEGARQLFDQAGSWLRAQAEGLGEEFSSPWAPREPDTAPVPRPPDPQPKRSSTSEGADLFSSAVPHPLDLPTEEQGVALAALDSGRWTVEPGSEALAPVGGGPGPSDALGLVRELRAHDWIAADGKLTVVGRHALQRWLQSTAGR